MSDEKPEGGLSAAETAFFETGGNAPLEPALETVTQPEGNQPPPETVEPDGSVNVRDDKGRFVKTIPFDVFHAEREQHKQTKAEMAELREFKGRMEERWQLLVNAAQQQPPADQDSEPDANTDIFAHNAWLKRQFEGLKKGQADREQSEKQARDQSDYDGKVWQFWNNDASAYKKTNAEFDDLVKWGSEFRSKQLETVADLYPHLNLGTEAGRVAQINIELKEIVVAAAKAGKSPSEAVDRMVRSWGFQGKPAADVALTLPAELAKVAAAQTASRTVGAAPGAATGAELTLQQIVDMPRAEFTAWMAKPENSRRYDKLMGA